MSIGPSALRLCLNKINRPKSHEVHVRMFASFKTQSHLLSCRVELFFVTSPFDFWGDTLWPGIGWFFPGCGFSTQEGAYLDLGRFLFVSYYFVPLYLITLIFSFVHFRLSSFSRVENSLIRNLHVAGGSLGSSHAGTLIIPVQLGLWRAVT